MSGKIHSVAEAQLRWINCSEQLPKPGSIGTFYGGQSTGPVIALFPDDKHGDCMPGLNIRVCLYAHYDDADGEWFDYIDGTGGLDRCTSHGGDAPTHWMPLPEKP